MKDFLENINKVFENRVRLAVMSILMINDAIDFNTLKETLGLTDGNLASHMAMLEKNDYISVKKKFVGKKTETSYTATAPGRLAFTEHLCALELLIKGNR